MRKTIEIKILTNIILPNILESFVKKNHKNIFSYIIQYIISLWIKERNKLNSKQTIGMINETGMSK